MEKKISLEFEVVNEEEFQSEVELFGERPGSFYMIGEGGTNAAWIELVAEYYKILREEINFMEVMLVVSNWRFDAATGTFCVPVRANLRPRLVEIASTFAIERYGKKSKDARVIMI